MKSKFILTLFILLSFFANAQKGYLGKKFSLELSTELGNRITSFNGAKINYVIGKKVELYAQYFTSLNSKVITGLDFNIESPYIPTYGLDYINMNFELERRLFSNSIKYNTDIRISTKQYGAGIRFYRKTKLAPVGKYFEIGYSRINGIVEKKMSFQEDRYSGEWQTVYDSTSGYWNQVYFPELTTTLINDSISLASIHQINLGLHRKILFKDGWFLSSGIRFPLQWIMTNTGQRNEYYDMSSLKVNAFFLSFSFGKMLF